MVPFFVEFAKVVLGDEYFLESESVGLGDALLDTCHRAHLAGEAQFGGKGDARRNRDIDIRGEDGAGV